MTAEEAEQAFRDRAEANGMTYVKVKTLSKNHKRNKQNTQEGYLK